MNRNNTDDQRTTGAARTIELRKEQKILTARFIGIKDEAIAEIDEQGEMMKLCVFSGVLLLALIATTAVSLISGLTITSYASFFALGFAFRIFICSCDGYMASVENLKNYRKESVAINSRLKAIALELRSA